MLGARLSLPTINGARLVPKPHAEICLAHDAVGPGLDMANALERSFCYHPGASLIATMMRSHVSAPS